MKPAVLVVDADRDTLALLGEWLDDAGWSVLDAARRGAPAGPVQLVLIELAHPRRGEPGALQRVAAEHPGAPVLVLSAMFHANVEPHGALARSLGVAGVLPKPLRREVLVNAVDRVAPGAAR
jgi:DNA-binding NtrC family response regulator